MENKKIREAKHRLEKHLYIGLVRATFTICVKNKQKLFINDKIVNKFLEVLHKELKKEEIINYVYVFMPDHLHLIIEGTSEKSNLLKAIIMFKQKTGYWLSRNNYTEKWQKDFFDHIHRKEEKLQEHIYYIVNNPIRIGLSENYKYLGSLDFELKDLI